MPEALRLWQASQRRQSLRRGLETWVSHLIKTKNTRKQIIERMKKDVIGYATGLIIIVPSVIKLIKSLCYDYKMSKEYVSVQTEKLESNH